MRIYNASDFFEARKLLLLFPDEVRRDASYAFGGMQIDMNKAFQTIRERLRSGEFTSDQARDAAASVVNKLSSRVEELRSGTLGLSEMSVEHRDDSVFVAFRIADDNVTVRLI